jgi:glycosyltransferase involved in cell wall biosynthesis
MKIAWIGKKSPVCGNVIYCSEITNKLLRRGHNVTFMHFAYDLEVQDYSLGKSLSQETVMLPYLYKSGAYTIPALRAEKKLVDSLTNTKFDLVHASLVLSSLDICLPRICRRLKLPLIATFHQPFDRQYRTWSAISQELTYRMYGFVLAGYDQIIVFSKSQMMLLKKMQIPEDRITIIPNSVDTNKYSPCFSKIKEEWQAKFVFLYQGRLVSEKNVEVLLQVWSKISKPEGYKLAIVGTGNLEAKLKNRYSSDHSIIWVGFVEDEQRRIEILRGADVFISPSLVEGLSLSLLEAMSCGVACIATDVGSHDEVLEGGSGIIIDVAEIQPTLAKLFMNFIEHPELAQIFGQKARSRILKCYTMDKNIDRLEKLYCQAIKDVSGRILKIK